MRFSNVWNVTRYGILLLIAIVIVPSEALFASTLSKDQRKVIDKYILDQGSSQDSLEYKEARQVVMGDIDNDGTTDIAVQYTLEHGNTSDFYLAVFVNKNGKLKLIGNVQLGDRCTRVMTLKNIKSSAINFDFQEHGPNDACCCPSKKGTTQYIIQRNILYKVVVNHRH